MIAFFRFSRPKPARFQIVPTISNKPRMNVFDLRQRLVNDYARYGKSFIRIADPIIRREVDAELDLGIVPRSLVHPEAVRFAIVAPVQSRSTSSKSR